MYTQCPQCLTIFEIDEDALQASLGIVRCGHCSERFDALRTLSDSLPVSADAALPEHAPAERTPTLTESIPVEAIKAAAEHQRKRTTSAGTSTRPNAPLAGTPATVQPEDAWFAALSGEGARALIADAAGIPPDTALADPAWQVTDLPIQMPFAELAGIPDEVAPGHAAGTAPPAPGSISGAAESEPFTEPWSVDIPDPGIPGPQTTGGPPSPDLALYPADAEALTGGSDDTPPAPRPTVPPFDDGTGRDPRDAGTMADEPTPEAPAAEEPAQEPFDDSPDAGAGALTPDPESDEAGIPMPVYVPPRPRRIRRSDWSWASGCLFLVLVLAAQIAWAQRAALVRNPATQAWALRACASLGCRLPRIRDVGKLELLSRDVRPDPDTAGALMITATVRNDAAFRQPWPVVVVELTDLDNDVVAMRRFRPAEYMPDPTRRAAGIAAGTTAAVAFEVADPGKRAVSFHFGFE